MFLQEKGTSCPKHCFLILNYWKIIFFFPLVTISRSEFLHQRSESLAISQIEVFQVSYEFLTEKILIKNIWAFLGIFPSLESYIYWLINRHHFFFSKWVVKLLSKKRKPNACFIAKGQSLISFFFMATGLL